MHVEKAQVTEDLTTQLSVLGSYSPTFASDAADTITRWLIEYVDLPPKEVVLAALSDALDPILKKVDFPGPDQYVDPMLKLVLMKLAEYAYDALPRSPVV